MLRLRIRTQRGADLVLVEAVLKHATDRALAGLAADGLPQPTAFLVAQAGNKPLVQSRVDERCPRAPNVIVQARDHLRPSVDEEGAIDVGEELFWAALLEQPDVRGVAVSAIGQVVRLPVRAPDGQRGEAVHRAESPQAFGHVEGPSVTCELQLAERDAGREVELVAECAEDAFEHGECGRLGAALIRRQCRLGGASPACSGRLGKPLGCAGGREERSCLHVDNISLRI